MSSSWDVIVIGLGGFGSAALAHVARRGKRVLGLEQHQVGHHLGSSHGETRIIRKAYFEHPDYVPLLERAYANWAQLEADCETKLFERVGLFLAGEAESVVVKGTSEAARLHKLPLERFTADDASRRFPDFAFRDDDTVLFEADAGFLRVEDCVRRHVEVARRFGAEVREEIRIQSWQPVGTGIEVRTESEVFRADRLIVTAGAWSAQLLQQLGIPLVIKRKVAFWFASPSDRYRLSDRKPTFFFDRPSGEFYGFPSLDGSSVKLAEHTGGSVVSNPDQVNRLELPEDLRNVLPFVRESLPYLGDRVRHSVCLYTCTPDGHFIVDRHPEYPQIVFGAGFSGHGFKFTAGLGEALADLALDSSTRQPIEFLSLPSAVERFQSNS